MFPFFVSFIKCEDIFTDFDPTQLEAHHYGPKSKWILNNASAHSSSNYIFFSCHSFLVCNYYKEVANIFENNSIEFVRVDSNFSFNNFSFTTSSSKTYEFNIVNNYSDIYEPIAFFYGNSDQKSNISEINESNYITIIAPESQYESMIKLSLELYDEIGFVNVRKTNESDTFQLWNPYERELSDFSGTRESLLSVMNRKIRTKTYKQLLDSDEVTLIFTKAKPNRTDIDLIYRIVSVFPKLNVMYGNQEILQDMNYLASPIDSQFALLYPTLGIFSTLQKKELNRTIHLTERQIRAEIQEARDLMNITFDDTKKVQRPVEYLDCKNPHSIPIQLFYGPPLTDTQFARVRCFIKDYIENKFFPVESTMAGSNNTWFNVYIPVNITRDVTQEQFWELVANLTYTLNNSLPWNEYGPGMPGYRELSFDKNGYQINNPLKIQEVNSIDKYFRGGADRANIKEFMGAIRRNMNSTQDYKPMQVYPRIIFDWLYSAVNATRWFSLSVPTNQDSIFNQKPAFKHLNTGSFGPFYAGAHDKCILFYDNSPQSERMLYEFSKLSRLATQVDKYRDLSFGAINVDMNYAQFMPRNISAPLVMKSKIPFIAVLPQQWYNFRAFIIDNGDDMARLTSEYEERERFDHPSKSVSSFFNESLWDPLHYSTMQKKLKTLTKKNATAVSPSGKHLIPNEMFYWSLQYYRGRY